MDDPLYVFICTIDESVKGAANLRRYGITFDGNIDMIYIYECSLTNDYLTKLMFRNASRDK